MTFPDSDVIEGQRMGSWSFDGTRWQCTHPPGPGGPRPPQPDRPINGPIVGVTDGSVARSGMVGEVVTGNQTIALNNDGDSTYNLSPLVLPPGDWDLQMLVEFAFELDGATVAPAVAIPGVNNDLLRAWGVISPPSVEVGLFMMSPVAPISVAMPTLIPYTVNVLGAVAGSAGKPIGMRLTARRMR